MGVPPATIRPPCPTHPPPVSRPYSLRVPEGLLDELKSSANQRDVPYQSLLKIFLAERIAEERRRAG